MQYSFYDLDTLIKQHEQLTIEEIFSIKGEHYFRQIETEVLHETNKLNKAVIACGGGTAAFNNNMQWLKNNGYTIYLKAPIGLIADRLRGSTQLRPLLKTDNSSDIEEKLKKIFEVRKGYYQQADMVIDVSIKSFQSIVNEFFKFF